MTTRIAILDDYQNAALDAADWDSLGPGVEIEVFNRYIEGEAAGVQHAHVTLSGSVLDPGLLRRAVELLQALHLGHAGQVEELGEAGHLVGELGHSAGGF